MRTFLEINQIRHNVWHKGGRDALVEDKETLEDLQLVLVLHGAADLVIEFLIRKRVGDLQTLIRERWADYRGSQYPLLVTKDRDKAYVACDASSAPG